MRNWNDVVFCVQMSEATLEAARGGGRGCVPFPAAGTNTLCVSDSATLALVPTLVPTVPAAAVVFHVRGLDGFARAKYGI